MKRFGKISDQVLEGIVQSIESAVVLHDRQLNVVFINETFKKIYEIKEKDVIGRSPMDFLPDTEETQKKAILSRLENTLSTGLKSNYHEFTYCSPSRKYRFLLGISIPIFSKNKEITHVMSVIHDLTRRKELEQETVKAAKLSSIADMAYTLAHEINNPLTGIKLGLSTLFTSLIKGENIQILESVMKDLNRIQKITNTFLAAKKKSSQLKKAEISVIEDIVEDVLFHLSGQLDRQSISINKQLCDEDYWILINRDGIHRVLLNLFLNALQSMPGKGCVTISSNISKLTEGSNNEGTFLCISLTDIGTGVDPKRLNDISEPFYSSRPGGTGLGLSICKDIVNAHNGTIVIESKLGEGTTINIYLPIIS